MWQEARKQEKYMKQLVVDYKKRAERRMYYYERIKQDPIKFLRVFGRRAKLHIDSEVTKTAENPNNMMKWIGDNSILIDRFDARANLEHYDSQSSEALRLTALERIEERLCAYERYRCLIHNEYAEINETMALKQIEQEEKYPVWEKSKKDEEEAIKKSPEPKAAIGFTYDDNTPGDAKTENPAGLTQASTAIAPLPSLSGVAKQDSDSEGEADSDMDIDVELDLASLGLEGRRRLGKAAVTFGIRPSDFLRLLDADQQLETELRMAKTLEEEKLTLGGRKSRRARRFFKSQRSSHDKLHPRASMIKIGLLHGQPISRRTVYLSASSSDSGDYPSDVEGVVEDLCGWDKPTNHMRNPGISISQLQQIGRSVRPMLTNARGPCVLIGGMTSVSLCRRRKHGSKSDGVGGALASAATSSSASSPESPRLRGQPLSSSSDSSERSGSRSRRHRHFDNKRSRVKYITNFGADDDDEEEAGDGDCQGQKSSRDDPSSLWKGGDRPPGGAASAVAASVVSKLLKSGGGAGVSSSADTSRARSPIVFKTSGGPMPRRYSPNHQQRSRQGTAPTHPTTAAGLSSLAHQPPTSSATQLFSVLKRKWLPTKRRPRHRSRSDSSRSGSSSRCSGAGMRRSHKNRSSPRSSTSLTSSSSTSRSSSVTRRSSAHRRRGRTSSTNVMAKLAGRREEVARSTTTSTAAVLQRASPLVHKRYYRPELESDGEAKLSDLDRSSSEDTSSSSRGGRSSDDRTTPWDTGARRSQQAQNEAVPSRPLSTTGGDVGVGSSAGKLPTAAAATQATAANGSAAVSSYSQVGDSKTSVAATVGSARMTPQELLNRRVQLQLAKAFNADKRAEQEKQVQLERERQARDEVLRRQAHQLRRQEERRIREEKRVASATAAVSDTSSDSSSTFPSSRRSRATATHQSPDSSNRAPLSSSAHSIDRRQKRSTSFSSSRSSSSSTRMRKKTQSGVETRGQPGTPTGRLPSPPRGDQWKGRRPGPPRRSPPPSQQSHRQHEGREWWPAKASSGDPVATTGARAYPRRHDQFPGPSLCPGRPPARRPIPPGSDPTDCYPPNEDVAPYPFDGPPQRWHPNPGWDAGGDPRSSSDSRRPLSPRDRAPPRGFPHWGPAGPQEPRGYPRPVGRPDPGAYFHRDAGGPHW